jgi:glucose-1-phosphate adenylyltransferase
VLSNFVNSHLVDLRNHSIQSAVALEHLDRGWRTTDFLGEHFVIPVPAQMRSGEEWYQGTADSVYQNLYLLERHNPKLVAVFGADHIYRMNIRQMIDEHQKKSAEASVAALPVRIEEASQFGVMEVDNDWRVIGFEEKPKEPKPIPGEPHLALVSMGNYMFNNGVLIGALRADAANPSSSHDFGRDILPELVTKGGVYAYDFRKTACRCLRKAKSRAIGATWHHRRLLRSEHGSLLH